MRIATYAIVAVLILGFTGNGPAPSDRERTRLSLPRVIRIPSGWFTRGSTDVDVLYAMTLCSGGPGDPFPGSCAAELFAEEQPARRIWVSAFGMDRTEVTNASYARCVAANRCAPSRLPEGDRRTSLAAQPVAAVTFREAEEYCAFAGGRLPTESEWERAARGDGRRGFPWGRYYNDRLANHGRGLSPDPVDGYRYAAPVGSYPEGASPFGALDMAGNVWEWTTDRYATESYHRGSRIDPEGPPTGGERIVRGGSWRSPSYAIRATFRFRYGEGDADADLGFRCAYDLRP